MKTVYVGKMVTIAQNTQSKTNCQRTINYIVSYHKVLHSIMSYCMKKYLYCQKCMESKSRKYSHN